MNGISLLKKTYIVLVYLSSLTGCEYCEQIQFFSHHVIEDNMFIKDIFSLV